MCLLDAFYDPFAASSYNVWTNRPHTYHCSFPRGHRCDRKGRERDRVEEALDRDEPAKREALREIRVRRTESSETGSPGPPSCEGQRSEPPTPGRQVPAPIRWGLGTQGTQRTHYGCRSGSRASAQNPLIPSPAVDPSHKVMLPSRPCSWGSPGPQGHPDPESHSVTTQRCWVPLRKVQRPSEPGHAPSHPQTSCVT